MEIATRTPLIEVQPMSQRSEIRSLKEDWTGKTSTAERRKLQNRLNKRASRKRRGLAPNSQVEGIEVSNENQERRYLDLSLPANSGLFPRASPNGPVICMMPSKRHSVLTAPNFTSFMRTPLPTDQKLLTLMHFNLIRALTRNVTLLGLEPDDLNDDITSPFNVPSLFEKLDMKALPPTLHPTKLQLMIPHHPEIDVFPYPRLRDNYLLMEAEIDDEFCADMLYGVDPDDHQKTVGGRWVEGKSLGARTGLIVWDDPWKQESWEVEEEFARKWRRLFIGCEDLIRSTNYWRAKRGEPRLRLEPPDFLAPGK